VLLVVFGAGASFDSVPHLPPPAPPSEGGAVQNNWTPVKEVTVAPHEFVRPPLANQLFDTRPIFVDLMEKFKDCQPLVPLLRQSGTSIEKKLAEFREQAMAFPPLRRSLAAVQYYLHFALWHCQQL
jgi:hypothetical protein